MISRLPNLQVLVFANRISEGLGWPLYHISQAVVEAITKSCQGLNSLHFRSLSEQPTLSSLVEIAKSCANIRILQIAAIDPIQTFYPTQLSYIAEKCPLRFKSLEYLSLGSGPEHYTPICTPTFEAHNFKHFLDILGRSPVARQFPVLKDVHLLGEAEWESSFVADVRGKAQTMMCGSSWRVGPNRHVNLTSFQALKTLVIVIEFFVTSLPQGLDAVECVEVVQPRVLLSSQEMHNSTKTLLSVLLKAGWRGLRMITLKLSPRRCAIDGNWHEYYGQAFKDKGIRLVVK